MAEMSVLFLKPFLTGILFALLLPLLGCYLRLRDEWLAAFAYSHVAAAGVLGAMALGWPLLAGGVALAVLAALGRRVLASRLRLAGATAYGLLMILGWALAVLLAANLPMAERLGHALFDGQLYFADATQLLVAGVCVAVALPLLAALSRRLLLAQLYPAFFGARRLPAWPVHLGFDLLAVSVLAVSTMALGVMGAFALVFVPPWVAFARATSWRRGLAWSAALGLGAYVLAFVLALQTDQPFGPMLVVVLVAAGGIALPFRQHCT